MDNADGRTALSTTDVDALRAAAHLRAWSTAWRLGIACVPGTTGHLRAKDCHALVDAALDAVFVRLTGSAAGLSGEGEVPAALSEQSVTESAGLTAADAPADTPADAAGDEMYVVLRWDRHPTWPSSAVGSIVDTLDEAIATASIERDRAAAHDRPVRFTVHRLAWPPLAEFSTEQG